MAHQARSNVCYAGAVYAGLVTRTFGLTIGGVDRKADAQQNVSFSLAKALDGEQALSLTCTGTAPSVGQDILLTLGGELLFGGTIQRVKSVPGLGFLTKWEVVASDWWWLLNRYARVSGRFVGGVNTVVARILATATDGGFLPGYLPQSLGDVDITCDDEAPGDALKRIAKASNGGAGAFVRLTPFKRVDMATSFPDGISLTLVNASEFPVAFTEQLLDQVRTRVQVRGEGAQTTAAVAYTSTSLPVAECGLFAASGTVWVPGQGAVTYTGRSVASGPGALTGVAGLTAEVAQGTVIQVYAVVDDATAQTALATRLGGGRSGIAVHSLANEEWSLSEATAMGGAHLALLKDPQRVLHLEATAMSAAQMLRHEVGAVLAASVTTPQTISGDFRLQRVTISAFSSLAEAEPSFRVVLDARSTVGVDLFDLLGTLS